MKNLRVLVPLDDSAISAQTVRSLLKLRTEFTRPLTLLHVLDLDLLACRGFIDTSFTAFSQRAHEDAVALLAKQARIFTQAGVEVTTLLKEGHARDQICALADSGDYDLLVIGRNPVSQVRDLLFGQVSNFVVHQVKCPVLIL